MAENNFFSSKELKPPALFSYPYSSSLQWSPFREPSTNKDLVVGSRIDASLSHKQSTSHHLDKQLSDDVKISESDGDRERDSCIGKNVGELGGKGNRESLRIEIEEEEEEERGGGMEWDGEAPIRLTYENNATANFITEARAEVKTRKRCSIPSGNFSSFDVVRKKNG